MVKHKYISNKQSYGTELNLDVHFEVHEDLIISIKPFINKGEGLTAQVFADKPTPLVEKKILAWMEAYANKKTSSVFLPLEQISNPPFARRVLTALQALPFGKTLTYGELAEKAGSPKAARAVGNTCSKNRFLLVIPCHRVIASNGKLGGFTGEPAIKTALLEFEGVHLVE